MCVVLGIPRREGRCVVLATRLGQRTASGPRAALTPKHLLYAPAAGELRVQLSEEHGERPFRPRAVRTAAELRNDRQLAGF